MLTEHINWLRSGTFEMPWPVLCVSDEGTQLGFKLGSSYYVDAVHPTLQSVKIMGVDGWLRAGWFE